MEFLEAVGFEPNGLQLEWTWNASEPENLEILQSALTQLEKLRSACSESNFESFLNRLQPERSSEPKYPESFAQVAKMVQEGETVPGIQDIEEKVSQDADHPTPSTMEPPAKPWTVE